MFTEPFESKTMITVPVCFVMAIFVLFPGLYAAWNCARELPAASSPTIGGMPPVLAICN